MAADDSPHAASAWFAVPAPVRDLFKRFPLRTHPAEALPARAPGAARPRARLFVFVAGDDEEAPPSHNPSCLKWQTYLRIAGVDVDVVPSNNHASPSGALPFLLPAASDPRPDVPLTGHKIAQYARDRAVHPLPEHGGTTPFPARREAYLALLTHSIRPVWLHALYLDWTNTPLLSALYLPSSPFLRVPLTRTLRAAAAAQVLATTRRPLIDPLSLLANAAAAFRALSALLADNEWFFGAAAPGLFDADVFAYTHLILDDRHCRPKSGCSSRDSSDGGGGLGWGEHGRALRACLMGFDNLVAHRNALYSRCWGSEAGKGRAA
ncbi:mitochondrial membrane transport complex protein [Hirsutella rhossiliensis]|uniref:Mitochondrial membrane transport complex protein n=1 Tax=Hirsutella rhossiliensis TaxID=111463 RepID=A0A9P8MPQ7_9HYPO|nr:mitochondrial membrane transport complex protein [Hirsutella rhossiliensis]KAH0959468.1 mitochondrial membrane transport complex protein [Hirsutella rhossiliensis]